MSQCKQQPLSHFQKYFNCIDELQKKHNTHLAFSESNYLTIKLSSDGTMFQLREGKWVMSCLFSGHEIAANDWKLVNAKRHLEKQNSLPVG